MRFAHSKVLQFSSNNLTQNPEWRYLNFQFQLLKQREYLTYLKWICEFEGSLDSPLNEKYPHTSFGRMTHFKKSDKIHFNSFLHVIFDFWFPSN